MADWQEAVQASVIALIFAFMVAKLVSVVISFRGENLRVEREAPEKDDSIFEEEAAATGEIGSSEDANWNDEDEASDDEVLVQEAEGESVAGDEDVRPLVRGRDFKDEEKIWRGGDMGLHPMVEERALQNLSSVPDDEKEEAEVKMTPTDVAPEIKIPEMDKNGKEEKRKKQTAEALREVVSDSEEWEGVESSELEERFGAAAAFVATQAVGPGLKISNETQLLLYGLYKLATEGPCSSPQPSAYKLSARAKWNAWQKLGSIGQEEAMHRYIEMVSEISPSWAQGAQKTEKEARDTAGGGASRHGSMGPVFSCLASTDDGVDEGTLEAIHMCAREGDQAGLQQQLDNGTPVDLKDSDGRTALHWAADRGHLLAVELLLAKGAQIHAKDAEGQTALHYATTCEQEEIAKYLVTKGAEPSEKDNEGVSPLSSHPPHWLWMGSTT